MREQMNEGRESLDVSPQAWDQSNRDLLKEASKWSLELSKSSKVRWLHSFQRDHNKYNGAKFQMSD